MQQSLDKWWDNWTDNLWDNRLDNWSDNRLDNNNNIFFLLGYMLSNATCSSETRYRQNKQQN